MKQIFLTVGTNTPFDRLIITMDKLCSKQKEIKVFGQIGETNYLPRNYTFKRYLPPDEFISYIKACDMIVSHAGMGTILTAIELRKPIIVLPRRAELYETRNNHQLSTCKHFQKVQSILIAWREEELIDIITDYNNDIKDTLAIDVTEKLIDSIQNVVDSTGTHRKVMCIASAGGHWIQLRRVINKLSASEFIQVSTRLGKAIDTDAPSRFYQVPDSNRWSKFGLAKTAFSVLLLLLRTKPKVVISTGAAPGLFAIIWGKLLGAKTVWVDSIANADELSFSGKKVRRFADLWLTQWPHLDTSNGPEYVGSVFDSSLLKYGPIP